MRHYGLAAWEQPLKWLTLLLGLASTICVVQNWQLGAMLFSLPFCLIWAYFGWLRSEPQLKLVNLAFAGLYLYGIARALFLG